MPSGEHPFDGEMILIKNKNKNKNVTAKPYILRQKGWGNSASFGWCADD